MRWLASYGKKTKDHHGSRLNTRRTRPCLEDLESRVVLYSTSGNLWPSPQLITISFMPDGTNINGHTSNLNSTFNADFGSTSTWENLILQAAQLWAQQTNINLSLVSDNGSAAGSGNYQQGDPNMGDIRIGGYNMASTALAVADMPPPVNNYSIAGDIFFNTGQVFKNGSTYDLTTVAAHEFGHALGMMHSSTASAVMYAAYNGVKSALTSDDIAGIQSIYGGARKQDQYYGTSGDNSIATAYNINSLITSSQTALVTNADITTPAQQDYYALTVPSGTKGTMQVTMQSKGLSLLRPEEFLYNSSGTQVASAVGTAYGDTVTITCSGVKAGTVYYVEASSPISTANGTGAYALSMTFGTNSAPTVPLPNTEKLNGSPLGSGGGIATRVSSETLVNTYTAGIATTDFNTEHTVGMDFQGNSVVTWQSQGEDGSGWGIYAQRYSSSGNKVGGEFLVNTTTAGDQTNPAVAMNALGDFVITWQSQGQDGSGWGIYAQRYNSSGDKVGGQFQVTTTGGDQEYPMVGIDVLGGFVITWQSQGQDGSGWGIYAQRYNFSGNKVGGESLVNTTTAGDQTNAAVAMNALGSFVVTWQGQGQDGSGWGIYAQQFNYDGNRVGTETLVTITTAGDQEYPSVAINLLGNYVITWSSDGQDGSGWGVYAQRFNASGTPQGGEFLVSTTTSGDQEYSTVAMDLAGGFVITWASYGEDGSGWGVYARQFNANGTPVDIEVPVNATTAGNQSDPSIAMSASGQMVIDWSGNGGGDSAGVFMQQFNLTTIADSGSDVLLPALRLARHEHHGSAKPKSHQGKSVGTDRGSIPVAHGHLDGPHAHGPLHQNGSATHGKVVQVESDAKHTWSGVEGRFRFPGRTVTRGRLPKHILGGTSGTLVPA